MKRGLLICAGLVALCAFGAVEVGGLPAWETVDTEVSTNFPFRVWRNDTEELQFALVCAATPSNCVQVSFGRDTDDSSALEIPECGLAVGWDCGAWTVRSLASDGWRFPAVTTNEVKCLTAVLHITRQRASRLTLSENGVALTAQPLRPLPMWLYDPTWDMIRLTSRGVDAPCESFRVSVKVDPFVFILK